ncbi:MAG: CoA transferase [Pseudomonadota bacterium]
MKGVRVIDMTSVLSGPFCTWLLSTLGADVIKVESPGGDSARGTPPFKEEVSLYFASLNRNKRSLALDLKTEDGKAALHKLLASADVLIENMRPGVRDRLGCSDSDLKRINPALVVASISGFGQDGSLANRPAYDIVVQAMSGMMSINGPLDGEPTRVGFSVGDIAAGLFAAVGILERLYRRDAQNESTIDKLDVSMLACQWACMENAYARYLNAGIVAKPLGSRHPSATPFEVYPTADRDIVIAIGGAHDWFRLCGALNLESLAHDERFFEDSVRIAHRDSLYELLSDRLRQESSDHWIRQLTDVSIPCSRIENVETVANSEMVEEYLAFSEVEAAQHGSMRFVRSPVANPNHRETAAPKLGEHNHEILGELGYSAEQITERFTP